MQLGRGEGVDEAGLGHDEQQHLRASQDGQFVGLVVGRLAEARGVWCCSRCATQRDPQGLQRDARRDCKTYLLHDSGLALGKGDVPTRLVLDELDLNLPALAAGLVVVVVVVVGSRARTLGAAVAVADAQGAIAVVVDRGRRVLVVLGDF